MLDYKTEALLSNGINLWARKAKNVVLTSLIESCALARSL